MFGGSTMGACRLFVPLSGFPMCVVHGVSSCGSVIDSSYYVHEADQLFRGRDIALEWPRRDTSDKEDRPQIFR
jgi:hypothetical protein